MPDPRLALALAEGIKALGLRLTPLRIGAWRQGLRQLGRIVYEIMLTMVMLLMAMLMMMMMMMMVVMVMMMMMMVVVVMIA